MQVDISAVPENMADKYYSELRRWTTRLRSEAVSHRDAAQKNKFLYFLLGFLPISVISAITSLVSQSDLERKDQIVLLMSCASSAFAGIAAYWNWGELSEKHANAAKKIDLMIAETYNIKYAMLTALADESANQTPQWNKFEDLSNSYNKLKSDIPPLSAKQCKQVENAISHELGKLKHMPTKVHVQKAMSPPEISGAGWANLLPIAQDASVAIGNIMATAPHVNPQLLAKEHVANVQESIPSALGIVGAAVQQDPALKQLSQHPVVDHLLLSGADAATVIAQETSAASSAVQAGAQQLDSQLSGQERAATHPFGRAEVAEAIS